MPQLALVIADRLFQEAIKVLVIFGQLKELHHHSSSQIKIERIVTAKRRLQAASYGTTVTSSSH